MSDSVTAFHGKTALITGAGQGIGREIARQLVEAGARVYLNDEDGHLAARAASAISPTGACIPLVGDASDVDFIGQMVTRVVEREGRLDMAIANAGITLFGGFFQYQASDFDRVMAVNQRGTFFLAQQAVLQMRKQSAGGSLLFLSSVTAHQAHENLAAYGMSKAAVELLARNLVAELAGLPINVNCLAPGATLTERTLTDADYLSTWSRITPSGRPAQVGDIAAAALFLLSPAARHVTGQRLIIDGGWTAMSPSPYP